MSATTRRARRPPARRKGSRWSHLLEGPLVSEALALALMAFTALLLISFLTYDAADPAPLFGAATGQPGVANAAGPLGAFVAAAAFQMLGLAAYLLPLGAALAAWDRLRRPQPARSASRFLGLGLLLWTSAAFLHLLWGSAEPGAIHPAGGLVGAVTSSGLEGMVGPAGAGIVLVALLLLALMFSTPLSLQSTSGSLARTLASSSSRGRLAWSRWREQQRRRKVQDESVRRHLQREAAPAGAPAAPTSPARPIVLKDTDRPAGAGPPVAARPAPAPPRPRPAPPPQPVQQLTLADAPGTFILPPLSLLAPAEEQMPVDEAELKDRARQLTEKFQEFGVGGEVVAIHPGPIITTFEFKPDAGIKVSKVTNLVDDLSMALRADSMRIERLAGKSTIGIEVPNSRRETIRLREILEDESFTASRGRLPLALGKGIDGTSYSSTLERMPHLLIAGATGSGKSVALNAMIASILFRSTPDEVKFIFIDPKMLELGIYEGIPHLICPVVTDASRAARVLRWAVREMTRRYELLFKFGVRNLEQFNNMVAAAGEEGVRPQGKDGEEDMDADIATPEPYLVVVIDELADLMMASSKEVEASIQRLAQMARAVGIHLIVATQRPSVDVLTGVIKANFPCRIAFRVASRTDSNVILDQKGAERLLGLGDMLFLPPGAASLRRIHGALMEESEALRLISHLKQQGKPVFNEDLLKDDEEQTTPEGLPVLERDEMYDKAARLVVSMGQASVSNLQRRLALGYARAARLMDSLEAEGIVGPPEGSKPRQVLVPPDYFEEVDNTHF
jgi:S-DNA-T family DNA segregation ATPase FtsK/SpoIIIE